MQALWQQIQAVLTAAMPLRFEGGVKFVGFDSDGLMSALSQPEITVFSMIALAVIALLETGCLCFFLPGDSLFVTAGLVAWNSDWPLQKLIPILIAASIVGDTLGYCIGRFFGAALFKSDKSFFFKKKNLDSAHEFFERYGGRAMILAKFVPIARTFVPVAAGASRMKYAHYVPYTVVGAVLWIVGMVLIGYALTPWLDPLLKGWLGPQFEIRKHVEKVIIAVVFLSVAIPAAIVWFKKRNAPSIPLASNA